MRVEISHPVRQALANGHPVVALETTVITHGLQWPDNLEVAVAMEQAIEAAGACPATLGIVQGQIVAGLDRDQIERFARQTNRVAKCSRRDLPAVLAQGANGSLTVAGTMVCAQLAGIDLLATGGIGGVHRGHPFDVSADLAELGRTPVAVVCAGVKSILDMALTLEVLESEGVPVVGVGAKILPAFFYPDSGLPLPAHVEDHAAAAVVLKAWRNLAAGNGLLFTLPPPEASAMSREDAEAAIREALTDADQEGISGNAATPYVLQRVAELTGGKSVQANRSLLIHNAAAAAAIAVSAKEHRQR